MISSEYLNAESERMLLFKLNNEYSKIYHNYNLIGKIKPAILQFCHSKSHLACWDPTHNSINITKNLCLNYHWHEIVEALKHEIAHQIVDQYIKPKQISTHHDEFFEKACEMICVAAWARHSTFRKKPNTPKVSSLLNKNQSDIERKIQKLLKLSESPNENEAAVALAKACELREKYVHDLNEKHKESAIYYLSIKLGRKKRSTFDIYAANLLVHHFNVKCIFSREWLLLKQVHHATLELVGFAKDLVMAEYVYEFLCNTADFLWHKQRIKLKSGNYQGSMVSAKLGYRTGLVLGFYDKLEEARLKKEKQSKNAKKTTNATKKNLANAKKLKAQDDYAKKYHKKLLDQYYKKRYPKICAVKTSGLSDRKQTLAGKERGKKLSLKSPIKGSSSSKVPLKLGPGSY